MSGSLCVAAACCALHDSVLPLLPRPQPHPVLFTDRAVRIPAPLTSTPSGPVSPGALCTPHVLANAINKAMFSVLAGMRLNCMGCAGALRIVAVGRFGRHFRPHAGELLKGRPAFSSQGCPLQLKDPNHTSGQRQCFCWLCAWDSRTASQGICP